MRPYWNPNAEGVRLFYTLPSEPVLSQEYADVFLKSKLNVSDYPIIQDAIEASTDDSERTTSRAYINRNVTAVYDYFYDKVNLTIAPVNSVSSVTVIDPITASATVLTTADYTVVGGEEKYLLINGYAGYRAQIVFNAGYADESAELPAWIRDAVSSRLRYKYAQQPMEMAMHERRFNDAEARHKFYMLP
jgi:hypothetical protein